MTTIYSGMPPGSRRQFWRLVHVLYLARAISRGPAYFLGYELRRQLRRGAWGALYRALRGRAR